MEATTNFKFKQLVEESGLSFAEKFDIVNIFNVLSDNRKIDIINRWPFYLEELIKIRRESQEKRKENIRNALININNIVNEAVLRKKAEEERWREKQKEEKEILDGAMMYDQIKKTNELNKFLNNRNDNG